MFKFTKWLFSISKPKNGSSTEDKNAPVLDILEILKDNNPSELTKWVISPYIMTIWRTKTRDRIWHNWAIWEELAHHLDQFITQLPQKTAIRTSQSRPEKPTWLGFGRMAWNIENVKSVA